MTRAPAALLVALAAVTPTAACGGGSSPDAGRTGAGSGSPAHSAAPPSRHLDAVAVIRRWSDTLRAGDVEGAAQLFAVPSTVENGLPAQRLRSREEVLAFNASLPCGARVLSTRMKARYTIATFRLTQRRGGACGAGGGGTAASAFRIRRGRIVEWLRVPVAPGAGKPPPGSSTS